jgi:hypothetical protein
LDEKSVVMPNDKTTQEGFQKPIISFIDEYSDDSDLEEEEESDQ